jgi:hypothetical protein
LGLTALVCFAQPASAAWEQITTGKVGEIFVGGVGGAYFTLENSPPLCTSAATGNVFGLLFVPGANDANVDREGGNLLLAQLVSAKQLGMPVTIYATNGSSWGCLIGGNGVKTAVLQTAPPTMSAFLSVVHHSPPPSIAMSANPTSVSYGGTSYISWSSTNATSCAASGMGWSGSTPTSRSDWKTGPLYQTTSFLLTCTGPGGESQKSVTVLVEPPSQSPPPTTGGVTVTFTADVFTGNYTCAQVQVSLFLDGGLEAKRAGSLTSGAPIGMMRCYWQATWTGLPAGGSHRVTVPWNGGVAYSDLFTIQAGQVISKTIGPF